MTTAVIVALSGVTTVVMIVYVAVVRPFRRVRAGGGGCVPAQPPGPVDRLRRRCQYVSIHPEERNRGGARHRENIAKRGRFCYGVIHENDGMRDLVRGRL